MIRDSKLLKRVASAPAEECALLVAGNNWRLLLFPVFKTCGFSKHQIVQSFTPFELWESSCLLVA
jgi:hypothetical protein